MWTSLIARRLAHTETELYNNLIRIVVEYKFVSNIFSVRYNSHLDESGRSVIFYTSNR